MHDPEGRFPWVMLVIGLALGLIGGLLYAWFLDPVTYVDVAPNLLHSEDQQAYILLVSEAYLQDKDLERARIRLNALGARDVGQMVAEQADAAFLSGAPIEQVRALTALAEALGASPLAAEVFSSTLAAPTPLSLATATPTFGAMPSPTPSSTPLTPTPTPEPPSPTPVPIPNAAFSLRERIIVCTDDAPHGRIEVYVYDEAGQGVPAVEVLVEWSGGAERFYTGLKPDVHLGYADFDMQPNLIYSVTLVGLGQPVVGLEANACETSSGQSVMRTYRLIFTPSSGQ